MRSFVLALSIIIPSAFICARAESPETITLKDGSVYMGMTKVKNYDKGNSTFMVDSAIIVTDIKNIEFTNEVKPLSSLSAEWKSWFAAHPRFIRKNASGNDVVTMANAHIDGATDKVVVLERGPKKAKIVNFAKQTVYIPDANIDVVTYAVPNDSEVSSLKDEVTTKQRTYSGRIVYESYDYVGVLSDDDIVDMIPYDDIVKTEKVALNSSQPIEEQAEYLDVISAGNETISGVVVSTVIQPQGKEQPHYIVRRDNGDETVKLPFSRVQKITKEKNKQYRAMSDINITSPDAVYAFEKKLTPQYGSTSTRDQNIVEFTGSDRADEVKLKDGMLELRMLDVPSNQIVLLIPVTCRQENGGVTTYMYSQSDLLNQAVTPSRSVSPKGNAVYSYRLAPGIYMLYRQSDKTSFLIDAI